MKPSRLAKVSQRKWDFTRNLHAWHRMEKRGAGGTDSPSGYAGLLLPRRGAGEEAQGLLPQLLGQVGVPRAGAGTTGIGNAAAHPRTGTWGGRAGSQGDGAPRRRREHVLYGKRQESNIWRLRNGRKQTDFFM